jgi:hypothetical protein
MTSGGSWMWEHTNHGQNLGPTNMEADIRLLVWTSVQNNMKSQFQLPNKWEPITHEKSVKKLKYKLKPLLERNWGVSLDFRMKKINEVTRGWINYFRIANMTWLMGRIDGNIRLHLRMCMWKQWKKPKKKAEELVKLGASKNEAWRLANSRKGYYVIGLWLGHFIKNDCLAEKGLLSMVDHYYKKHHTIQLQLSVL